MPVVDVGTVERDDAVHFLFHRFTDGFDSHDREDLDDVIGVSPHRVDRLLGQHAHQRGTVSLQNPLLMRLGEGEEGRRRKRGEGGGREEREEEERRGRRKRVGRGGGMKEESRKSRGNVGRGRRVEWRKTRRRDGRKSRGRRGGKAVEKRNEK